MRCPASLTEVQGSGTLSVGVLLLYVYLYTYSHKKGYVILINLRVLKKFNFFVFIVKVKHGYSECQG